MNTNIKEKNKIDMTEGPIMGKMLAFSFPLMASGILQLLFNAADVIVVGRFAGDLSLAAVGSNGALVNLIVTLFVGLSVGANVICAKAIGAKRENDVKEIVHTSMLLAVISGVFLTGLGLLVSTPLLKLMATPENVLKLASLYLRIYFLSMPAMMVYNFGAALLRANGDTKRPLIFLTISGIINVGLNLYFVIRLNMDVAGVAWATVISQYVSATLITICMIKEKSIIKLELKNLCIKKDKLLSIIRIGIPAGLQGTLFSISNMVIQSSVNGFGEIAIAGNSVCVNVEGFLYMSLFSFGQAGMSFTSQNIGAGKIDRLKPILYKMLICTTALGAFIAVLFKFFGKNIMGLYSSSEDAISYAMIRCEIVCILYVFDGFMDNIGAIVRGLGYSILPMIVTLIGVCVFRVGWILTVFQIPKYHTLECIYISYPISWIITSMTHLICYFILYNKNYKGKEVRNA